MIIQAKLYRADDDPEGYCRPGTAIERDGIEQVFVGKVAMPQEEAVAIGHEAMVHLRNMLLVLGFERADAPEAD